MENKFLILLNKFVFIGEKQKVIDEVLSLHWDSGTGSFLITEAL